MTTGNFGADSLSFGVGASAIPIATFIDTANIFIITDIPTTNCGSIAGSYSYSITSGTSDTLRFTLINDSCSARTGFFTGAYGVRMSVGIGANKKTGNLLNVYPNPSSGLFQLDLTDELIGSTATIRDMSGRVVKNLRISNTNQQIEVDGPSGIYFLQIDQEGSKPIIKKLIVQ